MAFSHGSTSYFQIASYNLTGYLDNIDVVETADTAETSVMGITAKTYIVGLTDATFSLSGKWDPTAKVNEVQTLSQTGSVVSGNYTLSYDGQTTSNILYSANAAAIQTQLDGFSIGASQIIATGGALPGTPVVLTFSGSAVAGSKVPLMTVNQGTLSGGTYGIVQTTPGTGANDAVLAALVGAAGQTFIYAPAGRGTGIGSGRVKYTGTGILTNYKTTSPIGGVVAWTADFQCTPGDIVHGTI